MILRCFSKINLGLEVLGRRSDSYHEIRTIFQSIDFGDLLELELNEDLQLEVDGDAPPGSDNLAWKAAETLEKPLFASLAGAHAAAEHGPVETAAVEAEERVSTEPPAPNWYPLWEPFHSELSADGFARRLERLTGLDYRVASVGRGRYQVAVAHTDDMDIEVALARIEAATGLRLTPDLP